MVLEAGREGSFLEEGFPGCVEVEEAGRYPLGGTELGQGEDPEAEPMSTQDSKLPIHHLAGEESLVGERGRGVGLSENPES